MAAETGRLSQLPDSTPVVIAGGGPVGLAVAMELSHHGVASLVIEAREKVSHLRPRAKTVSPRTMEHFRRWGVAEALRERAPLPVDWSQEAVFCTNLLGREITRFKACFGLELAYSELAAESSQQVPQPIVEELLREKVTGTDHARLVVGLRVIGAREGADGVEVVVEDSDGRTRRIYADYLVGCEGPNSVVRAALGAAYEGSDSPRPNLSIVFRAPGLADRVRHGPAVHYWVLDPRQPSLIGRLNLVDTWWCIAQGVDDPNTDAEQIIHRAVGATLPVEILATDPWRARMLLADRYGSRRMFVAGDAAHQNPPWGGHGFNTGIGDAVNLGWKLAAVLNGWAPRDLLRSYEAERRPIAARTIDEAAANMSTLAPELADPQLFCDDRDFERLRLRLAETIHTSKDSEFHSLPLTLGYSYRDSPIVWFADGSTSTPGGAVGADSPVSKERVYRPTAAPGHRLPHRWLVPGVSLYDRLGSGFTLVGDTAAPTASTLLDAAHHFRVPMTTLHLDGLGWREAFGAALVLVRPDQHVAWRGDRADDPAAIMRRAIGWSLKNCASLTMSARTGDHRRGAFSLARIMNATSGPYGGTDRWADGGL